MTIWSSNGRLFLAFQASYDDLLCQGCFQLKQTNNENSHSDEIKCTSFNRAEITGIHRNSYQHMFSQIKQTRLDKTNKLVLFFRWPTTSPPRPADESQTLQLHQNIFPFKLMIAKIRVCNLQFVRARRDLMNVQLSNTRTNKMGLGSTCQVAALRLGSPEFILLIRQWDMGTMVIWKTIGYNSASSGTEEISQFNLFQWSLDKRKDSTINQFCLPGANSPEMALKLANCGAPA